MSNRTKNALDPVFEQRDVEIDQETLWQTPQAEMRQNLRGVHRQKALDALDLDEQWWRENDRKAGLAAGRECPAASPVVI